MKELPVRKANRLRTYNYSQNGCYFITVCVKDRQEMLGKVVVGDGVLDVPYVHLSECGNITEKHIAAIGGHYSHVTIQKHITMPNHVHMIIAIHYANEERGGTSRMEGGTSRTPSPTNAVIPSLVSTMKRFVHKECGFALFQRSYHDHIIRDEQEYKLIWQYIDENPARWQEDCFYP